MREIKFRGLSINGEWSHGLLAKSVGVSSQPEKGVYISNRGGMPWAYQVRPETVGQYTGLKDKNGKEIYEGDVVKSKDYCGSYFSEYETREIIECVEYKGACFYPMCNMSNDEYEVIGNIYEHPELLGL